MMVDAPDGAGGKDPNDGAPGRWAKDVFHAGGDVVKWLRACGVGLGPARLYVTLLGANDQWTELTNTGRLTPELIHGFNQVGDVRVGWVGCEGQVVCTGVAPDCRSRIKEFGLRASAIVQRPDGLCDAMIRVTTSELWKRSHGGEDAGEFGFRATMTEIARSLTARLGGDPRTAAFDAPMCPPSVTVSGLSRRRRSVLLAVDLEDLNARAGEVFIREAKVTMASRAAARTAALDAGVDWLLEVQRIARTDTGKSAPGFFADQLAVLRHYGTPDAPGEGPSQDAAKIRGTSLAPPIAASIASAILRAGGSLERVRQILGAGMETAVNVAVADPRVLAFIEARARDYQRTLAEVRSVTAAATMAAALSDTWLDMEPGSQDGTPADEAPQGNDRDSD